MLERDIENYLVRRVHGRGGEAVKIRPVLKGIPDRLILLPGGLAAFCELKSATLTPTPIQLSWHSRLRDLGFKCLVVDSIPGVEEMLDAFR